MQLAALSISGRVKGRPAIEQGGRVRRRAQAGQHNEADSEPRTSWRVGEGADRRQWRMQGSGCPPVRGMSRSDKGCAVPGEGGKTTSRQEGIYTVAVCDDCFSGP